MNCNPRSVKRLNEGLVFLVGDDDSGMPTCASVKHVKDDELMHKEKIALNLMVELIGDFHTAGVTGAWLGPLTAYVTRIDNAGNHVKNLLGNTHAFKETLHGMFRGMPPANMKLPQGQADSRFPICTKDSDNSTDVEVAPIVRVFRVVTLIPVCAALPLFAIGTSARGS